MVLVRGPVGIVGVMLSSCDSQFSGYGDHEEKAELGSLTLFLASCSLTGNLLNDSGLRCLLECLPQLPISGWLE